jgi:polar amino acid transport system substrate-binding protein
LKDNAEVDRDRLRVAVGSGSAYDLFLTRELKHATIERMIDAPAVLAALQAGEVDVAAGIRKLLEGWVQQHAALRLLPGRFMVIQQAMGIPAGRGAAAAAALSAFVEHAKSSGFVAQALERHRIQSAVVAAAAHAAR